MTSKERLQEYIDEDEIYHNFLNDNKISSDFDMFCIQHCIDIEELLKENQQANKKLNEIKEYIENNSLYEEEYDFDYDDNMYLAGIRDEYAKQDILRIINGGEDNND